MTQEQLKKLPALLGAIVDVDRRIKVAKAAGDLLALRELRERREFLGAAAAVTYGGPGKPKGAP